MSLPFTLTILFEKTLLWLLKYKSIPTSELVELTLPVVEWTSANLEVTFTLFPETTLFDEYNNKIPYVW